MRILMLDNELPPLGGGMGTANLALLQNFAGIPDIEVDLITSALGSYLEQESFSKRIRIFKVPVWNRNLHHSSNRELILYAILAFWVSLRLLKSRSYDFCFAWSTVPAGGVAWVLNKLRKLPYMVWVSGPDIPGFEMRYQRLYPLLVPLIRSIWKQAAPVIAKCPEEAEMIRGILKDLPIKIIPNGADLSSYLPSSHNNELGPLRLICVARLIERKGQHHLIQAVRRLKDEGYDVTASLLGTGDALHDYQDLARKLGVEQDVHFEGYVPRENLPEHYSAADVFVLPSYNEGMSLAALEAMAAGLPVVLSKTGGTDSLVEEGVNGFTFNWADVDELVKHIRYLTLNRELVWRMGKASRERAEQFSWPKIADNYIELFTKMSRVSTF